MSSAVIHADDGANDLVPEAQPAQRPGAADDERAASAGALARVASGSFALSVTSTAVTILTTIALARLMALDAFGTYSWVVATVYLLSVPAMLGVDRLLVRDVAVYLGRGAHGHVRGLFRRSNQLVIITCTVIAALVALAIWAAGPAADQTTVLALSIGVLALPALALAWVAQSALMGMHRVVVGQIPELLLRPALLLGLAVCVGVVVRVPIDAPLAVGFFTISAVGAAIVAFVLLRRRMRELPAEGHSYDSRRWLAAAVGLVLLSGALFANSQIGVVMLGLLDETESAGLYAVAQRGALLVAFPLLALNAALAPTAARLWALGDVQQLQRLVTIGTRAVLLASVPIAVVFLFAGETLLGLVFGPAFTDAGSALAILSLGQVANAATGSVATLLMMTGNQSRAALGIVAGLALNLGLGMVLIPAHHAVGAAVAAATGLVVSNVIHVLMARSALGVDSTALGLQPGRPS